MTLDPRKKQELEAKIQSYVGVESVVGTASDLVNEPMIRHWCEAMGDDNPAYLDPNRAKDSVHRGIVAPPPMLEAWVMPGIRPEWTLSVEELEAQGRTIHKQAELMNVLTEYGYSGVVGTDIEHGFERYLKPGDQVSATLRIEDVSEEKATALGIGYFVTVKRSFRDQNGDEVGWNRFRILKFWPAEQPAAASNDAAPSANPTRLQPPRGHDNVWWWDAVDAGKLLIQKCDSCNTLRHPPRPMCGECQSLDWSGVEASGKGTVYSFTVLHHPKFPGFDYPFAAALIELEEGTRIVSNVLGCDPADVYIGMPVQVSVEQVDEATKLPIFRPVK